MKNSTIKGITVEIGGDVSPLSKALAGVQQESKSLQSQLRAVNELLKFDPSNTEAIAQKQKLLADAADTARQKLEILLQAQEKLQKQFDSGDLPEEEWRAFQTSVTYAEAAVKKAEKAVSDFAAECESAGAEAKKAGNDTEAAGEDAKNAGEDAEEAGKKAKKSGNDAEDGGSGWEKFGSMAKSAGKLAVEGIKTVTVGAAGAVAGVTTAFLATAEGTRETRTEMAKLETGFTSAGHSAEAGLQTYRELFAVLGDAGRATEASAHLALLASTEEDLQKIDGNLYRRIRNLRRQPAD